ncbi:MAG: glycosyl hydrolase [Geminicoccaceae bacterium]
MLVAVGSWISGAQAASSDHVATDPYAKFGGPTFTLAPVSADEIESPRAMSSTFGSDWLDEISSDPAPMSLISEPVKVAGPAQAPGTRLVNRSGLPWRSGAACARTVNNVTFEQWRQADLDVTILFAGRDSWSMILSHTGSGAVRGASRNSHASIGVALLPKSERGNFSACANGQFDSYYRQIGSALVGVEGGDAIIRLGWEMNGTWTSWFVGATDPGPYKACFRRAVTQIKSTAPNVTIEWTPRSGSNEIRYPIELAYPGDDYVDQIGLLIYDFFPVIPNQTAWNNAYMARERRTGGLKGIGTYLQFARAHGKKLAIAEWGVADGVKNSGGFDNPFFVQKMLEFSRKNTSSLGYEAYFNCDNVNADFYKIYPESLNPNAAAAYRNIMRSY